MDKYMYYMHIHKNEDFSRLLQTVEGALQSINGSHTEIEFANQ